jgi:SAM-dependent methyltransferase
MWPERKFDLIVISEILYYFSPGGVARIAEHAARSLQPDGMVVLVHWTHPTDLPLGGDDAVARFMAAAAPELAPVRQLRTPDYRLDILQPFATNPKQNWNRKG